MHPLGCASCCLKCPQQGWLVSSPDGKRIAFSRDNYEATTSQPRISPDGRFTLYQAFNPDAGKQQIFIVTYSKLVDGGGNLWNQPVEGGDPEQITFFEDLMVGGFAWSPDGSQLAVTRGRTTSDVILIKNFR